MRQIKEKYPMLRLSFHYHVNRDDRDTITDYVNDIDTRPSLS